MLRPLAGRMCASIVRENYPGKGIIGRFCPGALSVQQKPAACFQPGGLVGLGQGVEVRGRCGRVVDPFAQQRRAVDQVDRQAVVFVFVGEVAPQRVVRLQAAQGSGLTAEQIEADFALMEEVLILSRNRAWVPVIEAAAAKGPVFAAFGALHLSGDEGVLNLLSADGYRIDRLQL